MNERPELPPPQRFSNERDKDYAMRIGLPIEMWEARGIKRQGNLRPGELGMIWALQIMGIVAVIFFTYLLGHVTGDHFFGSAP